MFLEFSRVAMNRRDMGVARLVCDYLAIPFLVAQMLMLSYLYRDSYTAHRTSFVYFSTLYAFWCGLFGSCQSFNGEVASGEWSYWVLGQRRPLLPHLLSHLATGIVCALLQVIVCAAFIVVFSLLFKSEEASVIRRVADMLSANGDYGLSGYWGLLNAGSPGAYYWATTKYLFMGLGAALVAGTCLGMLVSAVFRNPQTSLSASVCIIVGCSVLSQTSLKGEGNSAEFRDFAPASLVWRQYSQCRSDGIPYARYRSENFTFFGDGGAVELSSWLLPQRFFFNLGRIPFLNLNGDALDYNWQSPQTLWRHQVFREDSGALEEDEREETGRKTRGCLCPVCIGLVKIDREITENGHGRSRESFVIHDAGTKRPMPYVEHWLHSARNSMGYWKELIPGDGTNFCDAVADNAQRAANQALIDDLFRENRGGILSYRAFFHEMAIGEVAIIGLQSFAMLVVSFFCLKRKDAFNELR